MSGPIVTIASLKGGSGKTTLACCLAVHWHIKGFKPLLIDADPQRSVVRLGERERRLGGIDILEKPDKDVWKISRQATADHGITIVDTPGFDSDITVAALAVADLVLIPVKASPLDVDRMMDTVKTLMGGVKGWAPTFRLVLTQTTRGSVISRHVRGELEEGGFPLLSSDMPNRVAYAEAGLYGATPSLTAPDGPAAQDIAAIAGETEALLETKKALTA
ncbi:ParA family protein [Roseibium salinum]|uniref:ParA family protein n=1 Tax=Roseibium salinum TaxID=1604349 RepID=A0ABT3R927_9HYPH|nr:ParA family protein [Roseibium sp. DSM 29163]MCX2725805.1 ParA family protein [Roseibium sp. DSM 29163]MDN3720381.1 ParA family protein [Roseibium salinum]